MKTSFGIGFLLVLVAACGYATVALFGKWIVLHHLPMYMILTWRFGGAAILFFILTKILNEKNQTDGKGKRACFLLGLSGDVLQTTLFFFTVAEVGASIASLLLYTFPLFVFLLQRFCFKQKAFLFQWLSLGMTLIGVFLIVPCNAANMNLKGILYGLGTAITYACYLSFGAHFTKTLPASIASNYLTCGASGGFALLTIFAGEPSLVPSIWPEWLAIIGLMVIATVIPLICLVRGMQLLGASQTALLFTLEPVVTIIFAALLFQEPITFRIIAGSMLILLSAFVLQRKNSSTSKINAEI